MRGRNRRRAGGVIGVAVRHEHRVEPGVALGERRLELRQMPRLADARVDERRRIGVPPAAASR